MSGVSIDLASLSVEQRTALELRLRQRRPAGAQPQIIRQQRDSNLFPTSFGQQRMWLIDRLEGGDSSYHISEALRFVGWLNVPALERALSEILRRHESLRTTFAFIDDQPVQVIAPPTKIALSVIDLCGAQDREEEVKRRLKAEVESPFDLVQGPLFRTGLIRLDADDQILMFSMHHIISDGWSLGVFVRELLTLYQAYCANKPSPLPELPIQYADFAVWQRAYLQGERMETQLSYWKRQLAGAAAALELPTDRPRLAAGTSRGASHSFSLSKETTDGLNSLSRQEDATLFMTLLAAYNALLCRHSGQTDISIGAPIANRTRAETEGLIGFFVNTLVLRTDLSGDPGFRELLRRVRDLTLNAYAHQDVPFEKLVEELRLPRNLNQTPLFQAHFVLHNHATGSLNLPDLAIRPLGVENERSKFDVMLSMVETPRGLVGSLRYKVELFDPATIGRIAGHLQTLLEAITRNPDQRLSRLPLLTTAERHQLLVEWNDTQVDYPKDVCFQDLFEAQAAKTPDRPAVVYEDRQLTYAELNRQSNQLAHYLQELGVGPESLVGLCMKRRPEMVVGLLGILKAGGAYAPLDPDYPAQRLEFMIQDSGISSLLTMEALANTLPAPGVQIVSLDQAQAQLRLRPESKPATSVTIDNMAYLIYTSGSTGRPKGAMITHRGLVNYLRWAGENYAVGEEGRSVAHTSLGFDLTVTSLYAPLVSGGSVVLLKEEQGMERLVEELKRSAAETLIKLTPAHLDLLSRVFGEHGSGGLRGKFVIGGEALSGRSLKYWQRETPGMDLINEYGPTETVVGCCVYRIGRGEEIEGSVSIGRGIANTRLYVLDANRELAPVGVAGELYIGGDGVARGYIGRPDQTAERFVPDPHSGEAGARLYRTGDVVRSSADGTLEFLGRTDDQVKIRGYRIELGEIEAALCEREEISAAAVAAQEDEAGEKRLIAYLVAEGGRRETASGLRKYLTRRLPEYMAPSAFIYLDQLPMTPNGKIDRRALPTPDHSRTVWAESFVTPKDMLELRLTQMLENLLGAGPIGMTDNFFELGGHSLLAVRLMAQIQKQFGTSITVSSFFQEPTLKRLADLLRKQGASEPWSPLAPIQPRGSKPPFFCIHALAGDVLAYYSLAQYLGPDQPFYGLQAPQPSDIGSHYTSIEDLAKQYLELARGVQPEGPYYLGGWSFGCVVAFEMAQQIKLQGQTVAVLALIDGLSPRLTQKAKDRGDALLLAGLARDLARRSGVELRLEHEQIRRLGNGEGVTYILDQLKQADLIEPEIELEWVYKLLQGVRTRMRSLTNYNPGIYDGQITLFRSTEVEMEGAKALLEVGIDVLDPMRGWDSLSTMPVELHRVPGYHATIVFEPQVQVLAKHLGDCIGRAEQHHPFPGNE